MSFGSIHEIINTRELAYKVNFRCFTVLDTTNQEYVATMNMHVLKNIAQK